ncbi:hypothetical protein BJX65DRAFT_194979 [Aspergillus insuetus]
MAWHADGTTSGLNVERLTKHIMSCDHRSAGLATTTTYLSTNFCNSSGVIVDRFSHLQSLEQRCRIFLRGLAARRDGHFRSSTSNLGLRTAQAGGGSTLVEASCSLWNTGAYGVPLSLNSSQIRAGSMKIEEFIGLYGFRSDDNPDFSSNQHRLCQA